MSQQHNLQALMDGLKNEVARLTEKVESDTNSQHERNNQLITKIDSAFQQRLEADRNNDQGNRPASIRYTEFRGLKQGNTKIVSFPSAEYLSKTPFNELATVKRLEYDTGTHIRCMRILMSNDSSSDKVGGFNLEKNKSFENMDIGKIEIQTLSNDGKVGRIGVYDRQDKSLVDLKGSYGLEISKQITKLDEDEKLVGMEIYANEYVVMGVSLKIAKCK